MEMPKIDIENEEKGGDSLEGVVPTEDQIRDEKERVDKICSEHLYESDKLIKGFIGDGLSDGEKEEARRGIDLRLIFIKKDMDFIKSNSISEDVDGENIEKLQHVVGLLECAKKMSSGFTEHAKSLSHSLREKKMEPGSEDEVENIKNEMKSAIEIGDRILTNKRDTNLENEDSVDRNILRLKREIEEQ